MPEPIKAVLIGAGQRGLEVYGQFAVNFPNKLKFIAVAEPNEERRVKFSRDHDIKPNLCFKNWSELLKDQKFADVAVIATQDKLHTQPTIKALQLDYDVLLEKPMATSLEECLKLVETAEVTGKNLQICHVLRYTDFYSRIHEIINLGRIGDIINISMRENVSYWHYAHSFVRGNWHNRDSSSPMILSKCCHDLDLLYWLVGVKAKKISSFGSNKYFGKENAPPNSPQRCTDGCPHDKSCLYNAIRFYTEKIPIGYFGWPISVITPDQSLEGRLKALREGPYGLCVYKVKDHNIVDHQVVNIEFENKVTGSLIMQGHSHEEGRWIRIDGSKGTITGEFLLKGSNLTVYDSFTETHEDVTFSPEISGHGGGDSGLIESFLDLILSSEQDSGLTSAKGSLESHLMAFAADVARIENQIVFLGRLRS